MNQILDRSYVSRLAGIFISNYKIVDKKSERGTNYDENGINEVYTKTNKNSEIRKEK